MRESTRLLRDCAIAVGRMSGARDVAFALAEGGASTLLFATEGSAPFKELHAEALPAFAEAGRPARGEPLVRAGLDADVVLLGLQPPRPGSDVSTGDAAPGRRRVDRSGSRDAPMCWVALRYAEGHEEGKGDLRARVEQRARSDSWRSTLEITASACSQARLVSELFEDPLTGLPGRQGLRAALKRALARSARDDVSLALLMINPDQFELVNARFGRLSGDDAMKEFALRLRARVRSDDFLARYGGASFALLLENSGPD